ncbi:peptidase M23 [Mucilaginibacter sp. PPCGB 2223]|uniref:murein hydrolase activator EnvC family protein n=1 Tax=Mucilaginibacter sp. PPCGB 2223 TaxID=1886027 RepID=UPI0008251783|nr:peptidoglycan DD-metalloendopeptidase family protein [Mucilaginibacter sp. PPCGB 2223]OCX50733.1 peptidase M23 [Mucilaginibacter sp. PPCGB 2223]
MKFFKAFVILFFILGTVKTFAQSSDDLKRQREQLNQQLEKLNHDLEETANNKKSTLRELNIIKAKIQLREEEIKNMSAQIRLLDNQISDNTNTVHSLQNQLNQLKKEYAAMVIFAFRNKSAYNKLMFVFAAKDFNQAYKRLKYMQQIGAYRERQARYITGTQKDLNNKIVELDKNKAEKNTLLVDQEKQKANLGKEKNDQDQVLKDLSKNQKQLKQQIAEKQRKARELDRQIILAIRREAEEERRRAAAKLAAEQKAAADKARAENRPVPVVVSPKRPTKTTSESLEATPEAVKASSDFLGNKGRLPWPVAAGVITQNFGVIYTDGIKDENNGINIKTSKDATIRAVFDGDVMLVADVAGTYTVVVRHGGYFTVYSNLRTASVSKGQKVSYKQAVGSPATDPATGDYEVIFEVLKGETYQNPTSWLAPK